MKTEEERALRQHADKLASENVALRACLRDHPSANALKFFAPFIRAAIDKGTWEAGAGTEAVERELRVALKWLVTLEPAPIPSTPEAK